MIIAEDSRMLMPTTPRKLARTSSFRFGRLTGLDELLTTEEAPAKTVEDLRAAGVPAALCI